jgi:hypothetical protein
MHTFLLAAILVALCIGLPAVRRALGIVALIVLGLVLWAGSHDNSKQSALPVPAVSHARQLPPVTTPSAPTIEPSPKPVAPEPKRKILQQ